MKDNRPCAFAADLVAAYPDDAERIADQMIVTYEAEKDEQNLWLWLDIKDRLHTHAY